MRHVSQCYRKKEEYHAVKHSYSFLGAGYASTKTLTGLAALEPVPEGICFCWLVQACTSGGRGREGAFWGRRRVDQEAD